jgi:hypothetical protein
MIIARPHANGIEIVAKCDGGVEHTTVLDVSTIVDHLEHMPISVQRALLSSLDSGITTAVVQRTAADALRRCSVRAWDLAQRLASTRAELNAALQALHDLRNAAAADVAAVELELLLLAQAADAVRGQHPELASAVDRAREALGSKETTP